MTGFASLSEEQIRSTLLEKLQGDKRTDEALMQFVRESLGQEERIADPNEARVQEMLSDLAVAHMAHRLYVGDTTVPLLDAEDFLYSNPTLTEFFRKQHPQMPDDELVAIMRRLKPLFKNILEITFDNQCGDEHPYDFYRRWFEVVLNLAHDLQLSTKELLQEERYMDEIHRRIYSYEQFCAYLNRRLEKYTPEKIMETLINPTLAALGDNEDTLAIAAMLRSEIEPTIHAQVELTKPILDTWMVSCIHRVFPN